jgi:glycosyltransferase involved in cell wall biosynthesis
MIQLSVLIPSHTPRQDVLAQVLAALRSQTLPLEQWELLLIDNASTPPLNPDVLAWHPRARLVREPQLGLTHARLRGIVEAQASLLVWVDDDNVLDPDYLEAALKVFEAIPELGAAGGASQAQYTEPPLPWYEEGLAPLGCRDLGDEEIWMRWYPDAPAYPPAAPIGAGMVIRKQAIQAWADAVRADSDRLSFGRRGTALSSGEDNDISLTLLRSGWELAYLPQLRLLHVIPAARLTLAYQKRMARASFRDFVRVLDRHGIRPWPAIPRWSIPLRALRSWFRYRVWRSPAQQVRWSGALGQFEGRATLSPTKSTH